MNKVVRIFLFLNAIAFGFSRKSLSFPEFIVNPLTSENTNSRFYIAALSLSDGVKDPWWKWFMPTFYEEHLNGTNYTVAEPYYAEQAACHIRMIGYSVPTYIHYHPGGTGQLEQLGNWVQLTGLKCYYTIFMAHYRNLRYAVHCPVWQDPSKQQIHNDTDIVSPESICKAFQSNPRVSIRLFPPDEPAYWEKVPKSHIIDVPSSSLPAVFQVQVKSQQEIQALSLTRREEERIRFPSLGSFSQQRDTTKRIVTTVQVFHNRVTGPLMCLFITHYTRLGFRVVIYDMFGWHYSYVRDLLRARKDMDVVYHPYTMLQLLWPEYFTYAYADAQVRKRYHSLCVFPLS